MKADILDIIFEKRNKAYGAYNLRKFYPNRLKMALGAMFIIAAAFSAFTLIPEKNNHGSNIVYDIPNPEFKIIEIPVIKPAAKPAILQPVTKVQEPVIQKAFRGNITIVDKSVKTDIVNTILPDDVTGSVTIDHGKPGPALVQPDKPATGNGTVAQAVPVTDVNTPMDMDAVDVLPAYPGGMDALKKFLEKHLQNPYDLENGETVNVRIKFVVGYNGKLQRFVTVLDGGEIYNKEVIRVLQKMPEWIPGKAKGENVSVYYTIPVKFVMSN